LIIICASERKGMLMLLSFFMLGPEGVTLNMVREAVSGAICLP